MKRNAGMQAVDVTRDVVWRVARDVALGAQANLWRPVLARRVLARRVLPRVKAAGHPFAGTQ